MPNDEPERLPRNKPNVLWFVAGAFLLLLMLFCFQLFGPNPPIILSRATTRITEPLGKDGLPSYGRYILDESRRGVTVKNNAAVPLWQALWPGELEPQYYELMATELGLPRIPRADETLQTAYSVETRERVLRWLQETVDASEPPPSAAAESNSDDEVGAEYGLYVDRERERVEAIIDCARERPWTSEMIPPLADWVAENEKPLDLIVLASARPRYYSPSPSLLENDTSSLVAMLLPGVQSVREASRALSMRAMWHLGEGRVDEAWQDVLAMHRLARLVAQGPTIIDRLVAIAIDGIACECTVTLLDHAELTVEQARQIQNDLAALDSNFAMVDAIDTFERLGYLDAVIQISRGRGEVASWIDDDTALASLGLVAIDWNVLLRVGNDWYDRITDAARLPDWSARQTAFARIEADLQRISTDLRRPYEWVGGTLSREKRSHLVAGVMISLFLPAIHAATAAEDRGVTTLELTRLAAALAAYRAEHGDYPQSLDALVPEVLPQLPVDLYHGNPFVYAHNNDGYLLYCVGENGVDDGGSHADRDLFQGKPLDHEDTSEASEQRSQIPAGADDLSIRLPRPALELPPPAGRE